MVGTLAMDVKRRAQTALLSSPIYVIRNLCVEHDGDALLISGTVDTFYHKQVAQEVVRAVSDGLRVINTIDVSPETVGAEAGRYWEDAD